MRRATSGMLILLVLAAHAGGQADKKKELNVDFHVGWGGCYRAMEWTPVLIGITSPYEADLDCRLTVSASQDELNIMRIDRPQVIMGGRTHQVPLSIKLSFPPENCSLSIRGQGKDRGFSWYHSYELWNSPTGQRPLTPVEDEEMLLGVSGKQGFGLMQLPRRSACRTEAGRGAVHVKYRFRRLLPPDWTAYASLDLLVLYDPDWDLLTRHQSKAIVQWVHNGGRVLLILGKNPLPASHPIAGLLPFPIGPAREVSLPARTLRRWGVTGRSRSEDRSVTCWSLEAAGTANGWAVESQGAPRPLLAHGRAGFGAVGVFAFDPSVLGGRQDRRVADFWIAQMTPLLGERQIELSNSPPEDSSDWDYSLGRAGAASNAVLEHLLSLEELRPMHIGWVVLVLVLLAVLIGPVDYLVLRALGRLPLTWLTASACIAAFSLVAYFGVGYIRGGVLQARVVSVLDGVEGAPVAWATRYAGIFAPQSDAYELAPGSLDDRSQWWSGVAPTRGNDLHAYNRTLGTRNIYFEQTEDGGNRLTSAPISIWSMQCLLDESPLARVPVEAKVRRREKGDWEITVTNRASAAVTRGYVVVGEKRVVAFGEVPPGQARQFRHGAGAWRAWTSYASRGSHGRYAGAQATRVLGNTSLLAQGCWARTEGMLDYLKRGAVIVCAEYDAAPAPFEIAGRRCKFDHRQFVRLVVFPEKGQ